MPNLWAETVSLYAIARLTRWRPGLQRESMQLASHLALERLIDDLVLLHARLAAKRLRDHRGGVVVAITRKVLDRHLSVGDSGLDQSLDFAGIHGHGGPPCSRAIIPLSADNRLGPWRKYSQCLPKSTDCFGRTAIGKKFPLL